MARVDRPLAPGTRAIPVARYLRGASGFFRYSLQNVLTEGGNVIKQAVGFLASAAGIGVIALLVGVIARLASNTPGGTGR